MPDLLLALLLGLAVLAIVHLVLRWAARADQGTRDRDVLDRVYYPTRGRNKDVPSFRRRRAMEGRQAWHGRNDEWLSDLDASEWEDELRRRLARSLRVGTLRPPRMPDCSSHRQQRTAPRLRLRDRRRIRRMQRKGGVAGRRVITLYARAQRACTS